MKKITRTYFLALFYFCVNCAFGAVNPNNVYLVVNDNDLDSMTIAQQYCLLRDVPVSNIIVLSMPATASVTREQYFEKIETPILRELVKKQAISAIDTRSQDSFGRNIFMPSKIDVDYLILCKGVPWQIAQSKDSVAGKKRNMQNTDASAVDSELSACFIPQKNFDFACKNPLFKNYQNEDLYKSAQILRVARLDGASKSDIINNLRRTIRAEKKGLRGRVYIDQSKYAAAGDKWLNDVKEIFGKMYFDISDSPERTLFNYSDRFDGAAIYFGWYSFYAYSYFGEKNMTFADGAIGWHIYSFSAQRMRDATTWTPAFVRLGAAATTGNVYEPFLMMTHHPDLYVQALLSGKTAGEAAYAAIPVLSWQNIVVGDPLYRPFLVTFEEQLENLEKGDYDEYSQYVVVRNMNRLLSDDKQPQACAYAKRFVGNMPDMAILFRLFEIAVKNNDTAAKLEYAESMLSKINLDDAGNISVLMALASKLSTQGQEESLLAMRICESLMPAQLNKTFYRYLANTAKNIIKRNSDIRPSDNMRNLIEKVDAEIAAEVEAAKKKAEEKARLKTAEKTKK